MNSNQRDTFKPFSTIVEEAAQHVNAVADALTSVKASDPDERLNLLLDTWISEEKSLADKIQGFVKDMDKDAAEEYAQYTTDVDPDDVTELPEEITRESLTKWLLEENARIAELFRELARTAAADAARESANGLLELMEGVDKRIARESSDSEDI